MKTAEKTYKVTRLNDICCNPANLKFGVICRNRLGDGIFSPIYATFSVNDGFDPAFAELLVTRPSFLARALRYQEGTVYERMSVRPEVLLSLYVYLLSQSSSGKSPKPPAFWNGRFRQRRLCWRICAREKKDCCRRC